jgi:inorganic phosphate transporter, PiT family
MSLESTAGILEESSGCAVLADAAAVPATSSTGRSGVAVAQRLGALALATGVVALVPPLRLPGGLLLVAAVAYANGANDVSKGIATLVGSGVADYRRAIAWGTACTVLGALLSVSTGAALADTFSKGLLTSAGGVTFAFAIGVIVGNAAWVALATRLSLPVSTTHALTGAIVGSGAVVFGLHGVKWSALLQKIVLPLLLSPFLGLVVAVLLIVGLRAVGVRRGLHGLHWLSSGATSLARGLNDAPKLAGLAVLLVLPLRHNAPSSTGRLAVYLLIAVAMGLGSLIAGKRVTRTLATKVTRMDDREGTAANVCTAVLVSAAALRGLPVSTTHVSSGSIIGIGAEARDSRLNLRVIRDMALAWVITLPGAGLLAVIGYGMIRLVQQVQG